MAVLSAAALEAPGEQGLGGPEVRAGRDRQPREVGWAADVPRHRAHGREALAPQRAVRVGVVEQALQAPPLQPGQPFRRQPGRAQHGTRHAQQRRQRGHGQRHPERARPRPTIDPGPEARQHSAGRGTRRKGRREAADGICLRACASRDGRGVPARAALGDAAAATDAAGAAAARAGRLGSARHHPGRGHADDAGRPGRALLCRYARARGARSGSAAMPS